jgi:hypothetical protein
LNGCLFHVHLLMLLHPRRTLRLSRNYRMVWCDAISFG